MADEPRRELSRLHSEALQLHRSGDLGWDERLSRFCAPAELWPHMAGDVHGYYGYLRALVQVLRPGTVLELGTCAGASALFMLLSLPEGGRLVSVDLSQKGGQTLGPCLEDPRLELVQADSLEPGLADMLGIESVDLLFVDTEHTIEQASAEWELYGPLLSEGGVAAFDDVHISPEMERFWEELPEPKLDAGKALHHSGFGLAMRA